MRPRTSMIMQAMIVIDDKILFVSDVARLAGRTPDAVRAAIRAGRLPAIRTQRGTHLVRRSDAEGYAREAACRDASRESFGAPR